MFDSVNTCQGLVLVTFQCPYYGQALIIFWLIYSSPAVQQSARISAMQAASAVQKTWQTEIEQNDVSAMADSNMPPPLHLKTGTFIVQCLYDGMLIG